jgi:hypothetical protein
MDVQARQTLLKKVIEYAILFQKHKRRKFLTRNDIEDAIHALGFRPLFSTVTGNDSINTPDFVGEPVSALASANISLSIIVPLDAEWCAPRDIFRKRKMADTKITKLELTDRTKSLINAVVDACHTGTNWPSGMSSQEVIITSWMLGLHFSDFLDRSTVDNLIPWEFVRSAVWFLQKAVTTYRSMANADNISAHVAAPWMAGLGSIAEGRAHIICDSDGQEMLIKKICKRIKDEIFIVT